MTLVQSKATGAGSRPKLSAARLALEAFGTFILVFAFGLAISTHGWFAPLLIGVPMVVMVSAGSRMVRAYCNPALTLAMLIRHRITLAEGIAVWLSQSGAGLLAAASVRAFVDPTRLEVTSGSVDLPVLFAALALELVITCALCYVALDVSVTERLTVGDSMRLPIAFGIVTGLIAVVAVASSAFDQHLTFSEALTGSLTWPTLWIYGVSQMLSGIVATVTYVGLDRGW
jgi:aquaporin Z